MSDSWLTENEDGYSVEKFYPRAGLKGEQVRVRLSEDAIGEIARIVQGKEIAEIRTMQDFVRDAVHHRLYWLIKERVQTPESAARMRVMQMQARSEADTADIAQYRVMLESIRHSLGELQSAGDRPALRNRLDQLELEAENLKPPWNFHLLEVLDNYREPTR